MVNILDSLDQYYLGNIHFHKLINIHIHEGNTPLLSYIVYIKSLALQNRSNRLSYTCNMLI